MKKIFLIAVLAFNFYGAYSQVSKSSKLGNVSRDELAMRVYEKDTMARALVLKEHANYYLNEKKNYKHTTDFYFKVKILKKEGFDKATISIPLYDKEQIHDVKGMTYALSEKGTIQKKYLLEKDIFVKEHSEVLKEVTFTMPDVKVGSVIEYKYSVTTPYSTIDDWKFQSDIPKLKSDYTAAILGNWKYNVRVVGFLKLVRNDASVNKNCVDIPGFKGGACIVLSYGIDDIPAFEEEDYMLSPENFKSKLSFELASYTSPRGEVEKYTKTWEDADRKLKNNFLDKQATKKSFFKRNLPPDFFTVSSPLEKAQKVFSFIKNHYTWDGNYWPSQNVRVKKAFEEKKGNIFDINLSLYNSLQALDIESYLVLSSTRNRAVPTKLHPVVNEFNYLFVKAIIDGNAYYLDASDKNLPFGLVQFQAINGDGRVLDFDKESFWEKIEINNKTTENIKVKLNLNKSTSVTGELTISTKGYKALDKRERMQTKSKEEYVESVESKYPYLEIADYSFENVDNPEEILRENYSFTLDTSEKNGEFRINPFLISKLSENPFKLKKRDYPVDFGYPREYTYILTIPVPEGYTIKELLKNEAVTLPNSGGRFVVNNSFKNNNYTLFCRWNINKRVYSSEEYFALQAYFKKIIETEEVLLKIVKE
ncbi:hypothetical protein ACQY1Q_10280 [Tenacibaculum sp. TC6]|uniref:hypothetical protein n=1 Tax=Tenacibaculum sp. TC6 TaxID=3423223 RepID=UPI003D36341E